MVPSSAHLEFCSPDWYLPIGNNVSEPFLEDWRRLELKLIIYRTKELFIDGNAVLFIKACLVGSLTHSVTSDRKKTGRKLFGLLKICSGV